ncbi:unnamed protein product [Ectocarpus fasciculatus]
MRPPSPTLYFPSVGGRSGGGGGPLRLSPFPSLSVSQWPSYIKSTSRAKLNSRYILSRLNGPMVRLTFLIVGRGIPAPVSRARKSPRPPPPAPVPQEPHARLHGSPCSGSRPSLPSCGLPSYPSYHT